MKLTKKRLLKLLILTFGLLFSSCQRDDLVQTDNEEIQIFEKTTRIVSLDQIPKLETIVRKVKTLRNNEISKSNDYLETLDLENIISVTDTQGNESYTIDIESEETGIHFEKLRLVKYLDGYIVSVQRFEPSQTWYDSNSSINTFSGNIYNKSLNGTVLWSATLDNGIVISNNTDNTESIAKSTSPCTYHIYWIDETGEYYSEPPGPDDGDNYESATITMVVDIDCSGSSSGGGSSTSGSGGYPTGGVGSADGTFVGGSGGSTSGGGGDSSPADGSDTSCSDCDSGTSFDLGNRQIRRRLKTLSDNSIINSKMIDYRTKIYTEFQESASKFKTIGDDTYDPRDADYTDGFTSRFYPPYLAGEIVSLHVHTDKVYVRQPDGTFDELKAAPIYSPGDLLEIFEHYKFVKDNTPAQKDEISELLVTRAGTFALVVEDGDLADVAEAVLRTNDDEYQNFLDSFKEDVLDNSADISDSDYIKRVIQFLNTFTIINPDTNEEQTLGIAIYQATVSPDGEITKWRKL